MIENQDKIAITVIERLLQMAPAISTALGTPAAYVTVKALLQGVVNALRRGVQADQLIYALRQVSPIETRVDQSKRVGKDPA